MNGYTTVSPNEVNIQPVAITSVDVVSRTANGQARQGNNIKIDLNYHVGAVHAIPAVGEQWYISKHRGIWRLDSRIPFRSEDLLKTSTQGQIQIGSSGPMELNGSVVNINSETFTINGTAYRDSGGALQRQNANGTWSSLVVGSPTVTTDSITDATVLGKLLMTAPDVSTVLSILGLGAVGGNLDGGTSFSPTVDPVISGGTVSGPGEGADLDGGTPESAGDIFVTGGTP